MTRPPYNPLDKKNLGKSIAETLLASEVLPLPPEKFSGSGIYALYYCGKLKIYRKLSDENLAQNFSSPIYVGKAIPEGARKAGIGDGEEAGDSLFLRLRNHCKSITQAENLDINDFRCRYLVVEDVWIPLGESLLIQMTSPVWNSLIDGFGNNDPGGKRYTGAISAWDLLHPGRSWAKKMTGKNPKTIAQLEKEVVKFLSKPNEKTTITVPPVKK